MNKIFFIFLFFLSGLIKAQIVNPSNMDTVSGEHIGKIAIAGYLDTYYNYNFNQPKDGNISYLVSMNRHNEANINLAYIDLRYKSERLRARFVPGFGTYVNTNYASETGTLKNLIEANAGLKIFKDKEIWLDYGVLSSPYTNESAISKDHLMYTRSFAPEYVPYYLSGLKLSMPLGAKITAYLYLINGWQQIQDQNQGKSVGTQIEYRPNNKNLINWNTYLGDERSSLSPNNRMRYFTDLYWIHNPDGRFSFTSCAYIGLQKKIDPMNNNNNNIWWQANLIAKQKLNKNLSISGRIEYFNDPKNVQIAPLNPVGFNSFSTGACLNINLFNNAMIRLEAREFFSDKKVYLNNKGNPINQSTCLVSNLTIWF